jgi:hypothetical protein
MKTSPVRHAAVAIGIAASSAFAALPAAADPLNLIVNGDFEAGATGFGTDYRPSASGCIGCVGVAATTTGWYNAPGYVHPYGDHTSGAGRMLQYDPPGSQPTLARIWFQDVAVVAGTRYDFSGWVREANSEQTPNNGRVGVYVDGVLLGTQDALDHLWSQWSFGWTAAGTGTVQLALRDLYGSTWNGTYSTIDDLRFAAQAAPVPAPGSVWLVLAGLSALAARGAGRRGPRPSRA